MKKDNINLINDPTFWLYLCWLYVFSAITLLLGGSWGASVFMAIVCGIIAVRKIRKVNAGSRESIKLMRKFRRTLNRAKKQGDISVAYKMIDEELLPAQRKEMSSKIYKYYHLGENAKGNEQRLDTLRKNSIWASVPSLFNDPFECRFMYIDDKELSALGFPAGVASVWDVFMEHLRQRLTTICFTQNPNDMPMWAHYANEHRGFCVEYEIIDTQRLYPVSYEEERLNIQGLFVELIYDLFCEDATPKDRTTLLKHIMLLCTFKDKSWKSENEIRAIFLNTKEEIQGNGRRCSCDEIGIKPTKIFIGVQCSEEHTKELTTIANELGISYEICRLSTGKNISVISKQDK